MARKSSPDCLIWDVPTRVFHWSLVFSFSAAYLTSDGDCWALFHVAAGYTVLGLIAFRLIWGFWGTTHARFSNFIPSPRRVIDYLSHLFKGKPIHCAGHNPAGSIVILALLGLGIIVTVSGVLMYEDVEWPWVEEAHEWGTNLMLGLVGIHILGVITSSILHRENLIRAMLTGCKKGCESAAISKGYGWLGITMIIMMSAFWLWFLRDKLPRL